MAYFGLSKPWIGAYSIDDSTHAETYADLTQVGEAVSTEATPNYNEASLYGDNKQVESVKEFTSADISMGITRIPAKAAQMMFGHTVTTDGVETSNANDAAGYVGYGCIVQSIENGVKSYRGLFFPKVMMVEGAETYETKGESVTFQTPTLSGKAMPNYAGAWRVKSKSYTTEAEAEAWIKTQMPAAASQAGS